jgi:hypothetical protein
MKGVQPSDVVTYTVADNWITTAAGYPSAATNAPVANYSGQLEPGFGGIYSGSLPSTSRTMTMGMNIGYQPGWSSQWCMSANWMNRISGNAGAGSSGIVSMALDGRPLTINGTAGSPTSLLVASTNPNGIDALAFPTQMASGVNGSYWTFIADETNPGSGGSTAMQVTLNVPHATMGTPIFTEGTVTTGVNSLTLTSGGSGYTDVPSVVITGGGGSGAAGYAQINANGEVIWITLTAVGIGYTSTPTVTLVGGDGSGATASATIGAVISGRTWQFTAQRTTTYLADAIYLDVWRTVGGTYKYTLCNEYLFSPANSVAAYPSLPKRGNENAVDPTLNNWLTTPTPKYPSILRYMGAFNTMFSSVVDASDFKNPDAFSWSEWPFLSGTQLTEMPTGQRTITITNVRTYALSTSGYPASWGVTWSSPNVYLTNPGTGTSTGVVSNPGWVGYGSNSAGGPYSIAPPSIGYLNYGNSAATVDYVGEAVTSAPHNLKTGQQITLITGNTAFPVSQGTSGSNLFTLGKSITVYVTGPNTFAFGAEGGSTMNNTAG